MTLFASPWSHTAWGGIHQPLPNHEETNMGRRTTYVVSCDIGIVHLLILSFAHSKLPPVMQAVTLGGDLQKVLEQFK